MVGINGGEDGVCLSDMETARLLFPSDTRPPISFPSLSDMTNRLASRAYGGEGGFAFILSNVLYRPTIYPSKSERNLHSNKTGEREEEAKGVGYQ